MNGPPRRLTVGRLMILLAILAVLLAAGVYHRQNSDVDRAMIHADLRALTRGDALARRRAAEDLGEAKPNDYALIFSALAAATLGDVAPEVRRAAVRSLGKVLAASIPPPKWTGAYVRSPLGGSDDEAAAIRAMIRALTDARPEVRRDAVNSFHQLENRVTISPEIDGQAAPTLDRLLGDADPSTRSSAIWALSWLSFPPPSGRDRAISLLTSDPDLGVRLAAVQALVHGWPAAELYPILLDRWKTAQTRDDRWQILNAMASLPPPPPEVIPNLLHLMETDEVAVWVVPRILSKHGKLGRPYLGAIRAVADRGVDSAQPGLWWDAVEAMASIDPDSPEAQAMLGSLSRVLREPDAGHKFQAERVAMLYKGSAGPLVPTLRAMLKSPVPEDQHLAAHLLANIGQPAVEAIDDLEAFDRQSPNSPAAWALSKLK